MIGAFRMIMIGNFHNDGELMTGAMKNDSKINQKKIFKCASEFRAIFGEISNSNLEDPFMKHCLEFLFR